MRDSLKAYVVCEEFYVAKRSHIIDKHDRIISRDAYDSEEEALKVAKEHYDKRITDETNKFTNFFKVDPEEYINGIEMDCAYHINAESPAWSSGLDNVSITWIYYVLTLDLLTGTISRK